MYASHFINTNHVCRTVGDSKAKKRSNNDLVMLKTVLAIYLVTFYTHKY